MNAYHSSRASKAWENFRNRVRELGGEVLEPEWLGNQALHLCRCANGHECRPKPNKIQQGQGLCRICAGKDPATAWTNFQQRVTELGGVILEQKWLGTVKPHRCRCSNGHECSPLPSGVQQGEGICNICAGNDSVTAWNNFRQRVTELEGTVLEPSWLGAAIRHRCQCVNWHECYVLPNSVQQGGGICRACAGKDYNVLYVTISQIEHCVKFGITNRDGRARLSKHRANGFTETLLLKTDLPDSLAEFTEQKIKTALKMVDAKPVRGAEYFNDDYLALILNEINNWIPEGWS